MRTVEKETANRMKLNTFARLFLSWKRRKITKQLKRKSVYYILLLMRANAKQLNSKTELVEMDRVKTNTDKKCFL